MKFLSDTIFAQVVVWVLALGLIPPYVHLLKAVHRRSPGAPFFQKQVAEREARPLCFVCRELGPTTQTAYGNRVLLRHAYCTPPRALPSRSAKQPYEDVPTRGTGQGHGWLYVGIASLVIAGVVTFLLMFVWVGFTSIFVRLEAEETIKGKTTKKSKYEKCAIIGMAAYFLVFATTHFATHWSLMYR